MGSVGGGSGVEFTTTKRHHKRSSPQWPLVGVCLGGPVSEAAAAVCLGVMPLLRLLLQYAFGEEHYTSKNLDPCAVFSVFEGKGAFGGSGGAQVMWNP